MIPLSPFSQLRPKGTSPILLADLGGLGSGSLTVQSPTRSTVGNNKNFEFAVSGTDSKGLVLPTSLQANFGTYTELFNQCITDTDVYLAADAGTPKLSDWQSVDVSPITGSDDSTVNLLAEFNQLGLAPYKLTNTIKQRGGDSGSTQLSLQLLRGKNYTGSLSDVPEMYYVGYMYLPADLDTWLQLPASPARNWIVASLEFKTGQGQDNEGTPSASGPRFYGAGDYRLAFYLQKISIAGTPRIVYVLQADKLANNSGTPGYTLPLANDGLTGNYFWYQNTVGTNYTMNGNPFFAELGVWLKVEVSIKRSINHADLLTGRTWVAITNMETGVRTKIFDQNANSNYGYYNYHHGGHSLPVTRIFFTNPYSLVNTYPYYTITAGHRLWDRCPFVQN